MNRIVRLTERDLTRIVRRVIVEQQQSLNSEYFKNKKNGRLKTTNSVIMSVDGIVNDQAISELRTNDNWGTFKEVPENMDWEYTVSDDNQTLILTPIGKTFSAKYWTYIKK